MNYGALTCFFCGLVFEDLPFYACCSRCYSKSESVRAVVDEAHPQTDAWAKAKSEVTAVQS
jgi:hypothetical protein